MKRSWAGFWFLVAGSLVGSGCTIPGSGWWMYRKDAAHTSRYASDDVQVPLAMLWERTFPPFDSPDGTITLVGPAVFGENRMYVPLQIQEFEGPFTSRLVALRLSDGQDEWSFAPEGADFASAYMHGPPVIANGRVYAAFRISPVQEDEVRSVRLYALDEDGTVQWTVESGPADGAAKMAGTITAAHGLLLFCMRQGQDTFLYALEQETGAQVWRVEIDIESNRGDGGYTDVSPIVVNEKVFVATRTNIRALDIESEGVEIWRFTYPSEARNGSPVYALYSSHHLPHVYVSVVNNGSARVYALSAETGEQVWMQEQEVGTLGQHRSSLAAFRYSSRVILMAGADLFGITAALGNVVWSLRDPDGRRLHVAPAIAGRVLLYANQHSVHAIDTFTGSLLWSDEMPRGWTDFTRLIGGVSIDQGVVVVGSRNVVRAYASAE